LDDKNGLDNLIDYFGRKRRELYCGDGADNHQLFFFVPCSVWNDPTKFNHNPPGPML
jgi:hypothetical protein